MLDPWIIEEILRRESEQKRENERARIELPLESPPKPEEETPSVADESSQRGVVVIDI